MNTPDLVGACGYVSETWLDLFLPDRLWQTILNHDLVEGKWLNFLLNTDNYKTKIKNIATGTSNSMKNISKSSFLQLSLPLPPLPEQQKIAQILSTWDEAIQKTETLIAKKQQLKIGLMQALLTGQKRFKEFVKSTKFKATKLGQVPQDWDVCAVSELFQFIPTNSFSRAQMNYHSVEGSIYNIHYGDIHATYNHVILDVSKSEKLIPVLNNNLPHNENAYLKDGDLVIADASEDYKGVGDCVELKNIQGRKVLSGLHTVALRDKAEKTSDGYRAYLFKNEPVSISMMKLARGSKVYGITKTSVSKLEVILPPKEEQQKIASVLSQADDEIESLQKHLEQLKIQKKGLMQTLLTGQVRVNAESNQYKL